MQLNTGSKENTVQQLHILKPWWWVEVGVSIHICNIIIYTVYGSARVQEHIFELRHKHMPTKGSVGEFKSKGFAV